MHPDFVKKFDLRVRETRVNTQKINSLKLGIFGMVMAFFLYKIRKKDPTF